MLGYSWHSDHFWPTLMFAVLIALALLAAAFGAIYVLLRNMGEDGIEVAAPGSCKSGQCGVRNCKQEESGVVGELALETPEEQAHADADADQAQRRLG